MVRVQQEEPRRVFVELFVSVDTNKFQDYKKFDEHKNLNRFKRNGLFWPKILKKAWIIYIVKILNPILIRTNFRLNLGKSVDIYLDLV